MVRVWGPTKAALFEYYFMERPVILNNQLFVFWNLER